VGFLLSCWAGSTKAEFWGKINVACNCEESACFFLFLFFFGSECERGARVTFGGATSSPNY
jgi:hypothetical protein